MSKVISIEVNGSNFQVEVITQSRDSVTFKIAGRTYETKFKKTVDITSQQDLKKIITNKEKINFHINKSDQQNTQCNSLKAPISGVITQINVAVGDQVNKGDCLIVLEAMKMQNNIFSPISAVVSEINVSLGQEVTQDTILINF